MNLSLSSALLVGFAALLTVIADLPDFDRLWDYQHPDHSETRFRELLPKARESGDRSYLAQLLSQIARTEGLQGRFSEGHKTLDEAEALLTPAMKTAHVRCLVERGRLFNSAKKPDKARPLFLQAWDLARSAGEDSYAIDAAHMLGIVDPPEQALEWDRKALAIAEKATDERARRWSGPLYNNMGWTYFDRGDYTEALALMQKALVAYESGKDPVEIRIAKYSVGRVLRALRRYQEALKIQEEARRDGESIGDRPGYVYEELGECYLALNQREEARRYFGMAYDVLSKDANLAKSEPKRIEHLRELGGR